MNKEEIKNEIDTHIDANIPKVAKKKRAQTAKQLAAFAAVRERTKAASAEKRREAEELKEIDKDEMEIRKALYQLDKERKKAKIQAMKEYLARQQVRLKAGKKLEPEPQFLDESDSSSGEDDVAPASGNAANPTSSVVSSESESESESEPEPEPEPQPIKVVRNRTLERVQRQDNIPVPRSLSPAFAAVPATRESSPLGRHTTVRSFVQLPNNEPVNIFARKR